MIPFWARAEWPATRPNSVHHIQARLAFEPGSGAYPARVRDVADAMMTVERIGDAATITLVVRRPDRLATILDRADLTLLSGEPLVLVSERYRVLAVATGPGEPPDCISVSSNVSRLEDGEAVEIPADADDQPSWQLLAATPLTGRNLRP
jgi:hypothetical protein